VCLALLADRSLSNAGSATSTGSMPGTRNAANAPPPKSGAAVRNAVTTYVQNRCGSSSVSSRVTQATE
jgi:hypothetical protein